MLDALASSVRMQRTHGDARAALFVSGGQTRLADLRQAGSAKAILPRTHGPAPEVVFLNTSGGVTGGDALQFSIELGAGAHAIGTTQTAERAYKALGGAQGPGRIETRLTLAAGARLDWVPQEIILFEGSDIERETRVDMAEDAELVFLETIVPGRAAMGETLQDMSFRDDRQIRRGGKLVYWEPLALRGALLNHPAGLAGARAISSLVVLARDATDRLDAIRAALKFDGVDAAASAWDGKLVIRLMATAAWPLRRALMQLIPLLTGAPLPRVWQT